MVTAVPPAGARHAARSVTRSMDSSLRRGQNDGRLGPALAVALVDGEEVAVGAHDGPRALALETEVGELQHLAVTDVERGRLVDGRRRVAAHGVEWREHRLWVQGLDRPGFVDGEETDRRSPEASEVGAAAE